LILDHDVAGEGDAVVLIHSGIADRRMWEPQWEALSEPFRVVRCDLRGYGGTPLPGGPYSNARDVLRLLDVLGIERASFVGSSFGGRVALDVAMLAPDRVARLALLCAGRRDWDWSEQVQAFWAAEEEAIERDDLDEATEINVRAWLSDRASDEVRELVRMMQRHAFGVQHAAYKSEPQPGPDEDVTVDLARIAVPVLAVAGSRDFPDFLQIARQLDREIPNARLVELDSGHLPSLELPEETTQLLLQFLDS
jgi:3-oxoadipate enol-lactonase